MGGGWKDDVMVVDSWVCSVEMGLTRVVTCDVVSAPRAMRSLGSWVEGRWKLYLQAASSTYNLILDRRLPPQHGRETKSSGSSSKANQARLLGEMTPKESPDST